MNHVERFLAVMNFQPVDRLPHAEAEALAEKLANIPLTPLMAMKRIVNQAINLKAVDLLLIYCGLYLAAVIINGALKYLISVLQTIIGQRAAAGMRKELYRHTLNLPLTFFRKTQPGMVVQSFATELATAGDFVWTGLIYTEGTLRSTGTIHVLGGVMTAGGGQSVAIASGVEAAAARWIVTIDGDGQNDPADLPRVGTSDAAEPPGGPSGDDATTPRDADAEGLPSRDHATDA